MTQVSIQKLKIPFRSFVRVNGAAAEAVTQVGKTAYVGADIDYNIPATEAHFPDLVLVVQEHRMPDRPSLKAIAHGKAPKCLSFGGLNSGHDSRFFQSFDTQEEMPVLEQQPIAGDDQSSD